MIEDVVVDWVDGTIFFVVVDGVDGTTFFDVDGDIDGVWLFNAFFDLETEISELSTVEVVVTFRSIWEERICSQVDIFN